MLFWIFYRADFPTFLMCKKSSSKFVTSDWVIMKLVCGHSLYLPTFYAGKVYL